MDQRFTMLAEAAAETHGVFTTSTAQRIGISDRLRNEWLNQHKIERLGTHTFRFAGAPVTWHSTLMAGLGDLGPAAGSGRSLVGCGATP